MNGSLKLEDKAFLTKLAEEVKARRMTTPAIFFFRNDETFELCWKPSYDFFWSNN